MTAASANSRPYATCQVRLLDTVTYRDGLDLQRALVTARKKGYIPDTLLLLQHPPTITLGRSANPEQVLADPSALAACGIELFETNRGGQATYHGPGQLVSYPIMSLRPDRCDVRRYLRDLEEVVLRTLGDLGIRAHRRAGLTGVWVDKDKIAAIGVHLSSWITSHGIAVNVTTQLDPFRLIIPCGLEPNVYGVTSIERVLQTPIDISIIQQRFIEHFGYIFERQMEIVPIDQESVQVIVISNDTREPEIMLLKRTAHRGGFWQPITGTVEVGESPAAAAARELREETGLIGQPWNLNLVHCFRIEPWLAKYQLTRPTINREHSFCFAASRRGPLLTSGEHTSARWWALAAAQRQVRWDSARRALELAIKRWTERGLH